MSARNRFRPTLTALDERALPDGTLGDPPAGGPPAQPPTTPVLAHNEWFQLAVAGDDALWIGAHEDGSVWLSSGPAAAQTLIYLGEMGDDNSLTPVMSVVEAPPPRGVAPPPRPLLLPPVDPNPPRVTVGGLHVWYDRGNDYLGISLPGLPPMHIKPGNGNIHIDVPGVGGGTFQLPKPKPDPNAPHGPDRPPVGS